MLNEPMRTKDQVQVILYSKPGCHLCEVMKKELAKADCAELYELARDQY